MKVRIHLIGAVFGSVCALGFALAPFVAKADVGPGKYVAPSSSAPTSGSVNRPTKRHMHRGNVGRYDDGCGS